MMKGLYSQAHITSLSPLHTFCVSCDIEHKHLLYIIDYFSILSVLMINAASCAHKSTLVRVSSCRTLYLKKYMYKK